ncbi:MAG: lyase family protein [Acidothermaceae bacterium]
MKQPSSKSEGSSGHAGLLGPLFVSPDTERELSDEALLRAMLDAESALAQAESAAGVIPAEAASAIAATCERSAADGGVIDVDRIGVEAQASGNPVVPLVRALAAELPDRARPWVHYGTTSQDILDTALMLVTRRFGRGLLRLAADATRECAQLVDRHRDTAMAARTLGQQAGFTTFGLKAAGWLASLDDAVARLHDVLYHRLAVQLGGAAGNLGVLGDAGPAVLDEFAALLELDAPVVPWHTDRQRILDIACAAAALIAAAGKLAVDVERLAQTEIAEVSEGSIGSGGERHGGSSALPHKHNAVDAVLIRSAAFRAPGLLATMFTAAAQHENERAAGAWHAEWQPLRELLSIAGGCLARTGKLLSGLEVHAQRMRENLDASQGLLFAEHVAARLMPALGRRNAQTLVADCCEKAVKTGVPLHDLMASNAEVAGYFSAAQLDELFDAATALRAVGPLIDRALAAHVLHGEIGQR